MALVTEILKHRAVHAEGIFSQARWLHFQAVIGVSLCIRRVGAVIILCACWSGLDNYSQPLPLPTSFLSDLGGRIWRMVVLMKVRNWLEASVIQEGLWYLPLPHPLKIH